MRWSRVAWGAGFILLGAILLLFTTGVLPWRAWALLGTLWPVLLVIAGAELLIRRRVSLGWLLVGACLIVLAGGALLAAGLLPGWLVPFRGGLADYRAPAPEPLPGGIGVYTLEQPTGPDIQEAEVRVSFGGGILRIGPGEAGVLARGTLEYAAERPRVDCREDGGRARLEISPAPRTWFGPGVARRGLRWELRLSPQLMLDLRVDAGACSGEIDLSTLQIRRLTVNAGAGDVDLRLGNQGFPGRVVVGAGASDLTISVPRDAGLRITIDGALASHNFEQAGLNRSGGVWETPGYAAATTRYEIDIDAGVSNIRLERASSF